MVSSQDIILIKRDVRRLEEDHVIPNCHSLGITGSVLPSLRLIFGPLLQVYIILKDRDYAWSKGPSERDSIPSREDNAKEKRVLMGVVLLSGGNIIRITSRFVVFSSILVQAGQRFDSLLRIDQPEE